MHKKVKRFGLEGTIADDSMFIKSREDYEKMLTDSMRDSGYVPVLGMGPYFSTTFDHDRKVYAFVVSAYGVFVGEKKGWKYEGLDLSDGRLYKKTTPANK
jgi:hypothetical protein